MAASAIGVRFVRCPKCDKLLTEFAQVPIYRCGGCATLLRVKVQHVSIGEQTARESLENVSTTLVESSTSSANYKSAPSSSSEVANGEAKVAQSDHHRASNSKVAHDHSNGKEEVTEHGGISSDVIAARKDVYVDEEEETKMSLQDPNSSSLNEETKEGVDIELTSLAYDGSVYSGDEQQQAHVPHKSKRSFRHNKALSTDTATTDLYGRDTTTFGWSDDLHSVQNWMGSEIDHDDPITLSKDLLFRGNSNFSSYSEPDQAKILRKVDELRDELSEFLTTSEVPIRNDVESGRRRHGRIRAKKQPVIKQYYRPVCGGAPFVVCYKCWKLLRLPADFIVSRSKTLHRLRCGGCSETLVFSFLPRVPRTPADEAQHPPSEVEHHSRSECCYSEPEPEPEPVHNVSRNSSCSSLTGSRLHRLMGYSSATDVLFRSGHAGVEYECSKTSTLAPRVDRRGYGAGTSTYRGGGKIP